jgi:hypothetical protein
MLHTRNDFKCIFSSDKEREEVWQRNSLETYTETAKKYLLQKRSHIKIFED